MKILVNKYEQNEYADSRLCNNGGGYFQPLLLVDATYGGGNWKAEISDTSCGDFGSEISADIVIDDTIYSCYYGSRVTEGCAWSNIDYDVAGEVLDILANFFGYHLPIASEFPDEDPHQGDLDLEKIGNDQDEESYQGWYVVDTDDQESARYSTYYPWSCEDEED